MKRGLNIHINFTNRVLYTFIAFIILLIIGVGVFALTPGVKPNPGHLIDNVAPPSQCSTGQVLQWDGSGWTCIDQSVGAGGDITAVTAGTGLSGGGTSGSVTLSTDTIYLQRRVSGSCPAGTSIRVISSTGSVTCEIDDLGEQCTESFPSCAAGCSILCTSNGWTCLLCPGGIGEGVGGENSGGGGDGGSGGGGAGGGY